MSAFLEKSNFNNLATTALFKEGLYSPGVHSCYYRCVQLLLHIIFYKIGKDKQDFDNDRRLRKDGSHGHAIFTVGERLAKNISSNDANKRAYKDFQRFIAELKYLREDADYSEEIIGQEKGMKAKSLSDSIVNILNQGNIKWK